MTRNVEFKGFEPSQSIRAFIERLASNIERKTQRLSPVFFRMEIEEVPVHKIYRIHITLDVPQKTLVAKQETHDLEAGIRTAFAEIERQVEAHKASLRGEHSWKRMARRKELHDMKAGGPEMETEAGAEFFSGVEPHIETLNNFVRHIIVSAESNGDLPKGELDPEDLVTETLLRAHEEFTHRRPKDRSIRNWLMRVALKQLEVEIDRIRKERSQAIDIEGDVPETYRPEEAEALGDELVDFYEPDEEFNVEEILPEIEVPSPEQEMETREFRRCVREALNAMRADWRQAVFLRYVLGMSGNKLAKFIKKPVEEVPQILEDARAELRRLLTESGCVFGEITRASD